MKEFSDSIYIQALPQKSYLESIGLKESEISFFIDEYINNEKYAMYPLVGLNYKQIEKYFEWKTEELGFAYLEYKKLYIRNNDVNTPLKTFIDSVGFLPIQLATYRIPTPSVGISDIKSGYNRSFYRNEFIENQFFEWLKTHQRYSHLSISKLKNERYPNQYLEEFELEPSKYYDLKRFRRIMKNTYEIAGIVLNFKEPDEDEFKKVESSNTHFIEILGVKLVIMDFTGRIRFSSINRLLCPIRSGSVNFEDNLQQLKRTDLEYSNLK